MEWFGKVLKWIGIFFGIAKKSKELIDDASDDSASKKKDKGPCDE